jgi:hypothetical protein
MIGVFAKGGSRADFTPEVGLPWKAWQDTTLVTVPKPTSLEMGVADESGGRHHGGGGNTCCCEYSGTIRR